MASSDYMIYRPEKAGFGDLVRLCLIGKGRLSDCKFVETSQSPGKDDLRIDLIVALTLLLQKLLLVMKWPMRIFGFIFEHYLNFISLNGGSFFHLIFHAIPSFSVVLPKPDTKNFRSIIGHVDGRLDLNKTSSLLMFLPENGALNDDVNLLDHMDLMIMASKVAYENEAYIKNAVENHWKMHFVRYFNCWNVFLQEFATQAYVFCDRSEDARLIVVAFRGTEPFNANDWMTDIDLSWISMGQMGKAHPGFMKALGLQHDKSYIKGWPKDYKGDKDKPLAYYIIRDTLKTLLQQHKNAKIVVTGHSLGAALAAIFPSILILHEETTILNSLAGVMNCGQPRVGDETFGGFIEAQLRRPGKSFYRVVYRYDMVPRVPFDDPVTQFKHFGRCLYFSSWEKWQVVKVEPNKNYFDPKFLPSKFFSSWKDLVMCLFLSKAHGKEFEESGASISLRLIGLLIPGVGSHSPRDYLNAARLGKITISEK